MDMIDIDDDDVDITGPHHVPLRQIAFPYNPEREVPGYNIREHLHELPVRLISHNKKHMERDVWECEACGRILAAYLQDEIGIGLDLILFVLFNASLETLFLKQYLGSVCGILWVPYQ